MNKSHLKNIIIVAVLIAVLFVGYIFLKGERYDDELLSSSSPSELTVVDELFSLLNALSRLRIDSSIFEKESYKALKDFSVTLTQEPQGRTNPFRPI